ncbi:uncharacterized protein LOC132624129 [Lycium barbarum]|uniref:uncharacterized protein LOC132624129 n=1 Tax=Lycium barbarum TaxID=112863 RepID=UPI00293EE2B0|nr:uncharacterized protein LOC132624129 [Lycium barbarum]
MGHTEHQDSTIYLVQKFCKRFRKIEFKNTPRVQNELGDALATISSMIQYPERSYIDPLEINLKEQHAYGSRVEAKLDGKPWYTDMKRYLENGEYPKYATNSQKKTIRRMANNFFLSEEILCRRTPDLGLLRCVDTEESKRFLEAYRVMFVLVQDAKDRHWR